MKWKVLLVASIGCKLREVELKIIRMSGLAFVNLRELLELRMARCYLHPALGFWDSEQLEF